MQPETVDDVLKQVKRRKYAGVIVIGRDEDGEVFTHTSEYPDDAYRMLRVSIAVLAWLMTPAEHMARA